jgi:predicted DNA-binding transcriptional regulator AlpA
MFTGLPTIDTAGAAEYTGLSRSTLEKMRLYGGGPKFLKLRRLVKYRIADLDAWMDAHLMSTTSSKAESSHE